jgi:diguanylate cyclase (GGDEF)-like protein
MMTLRSKVLIILASMWAVIICIIFVDSRFTLIEHYKQLERKDVVENVDHANKAMDAMLGSLKLLNNDWAQWNDAYQFMQNKNETFIKNNMAFTTFANAKINYILFFNNLGKLFYGQAYDLKKQKNIPIPPDLIHYLESHPSFTIHSNETSFKVGFIKIPTGWVATSSLPILTSEGKGPIRGTLIMGFDVTPSHMEALSDSIGMKAQLFQIPPPASNSLVVKAYEQLKTGTEIDTNPVTKNTMYGFTFLRDIESQPIGMLSVEVPRVLFNESLSTIYHYLAILVSVGIIVIVLMWYLLKVFVLDRIISVSKQLIAINSESNFSKRINISGKDEIGNMVAVMNLLMEIIQITQEQLKYRIFQRTEQLERLSDLNKNLSTEINRQRNIESKLRENEKLFKQMAYYDALTGLPNRIYFNDALRNAMDQLNNHDEMIAVLFLDVDKLKYINDSFGHEIGDCFIKHVAQKLKESLREDIILARLAGDEFILFLNNVREKTEIDIIAERILETVSLPLIMEDIKVTSTCSIGISLYPSNGLTIEELQKNADLAMYYAKKQSGNTYCYFDTIIKDISTSIF